jgi:hypothetical protein
MNHRYSHLLQAKVISKLDLLITAVLAISSNIDLQTIHIHHLQSKDWHIGFINGTTFL